MSKLQQLEQALDLWISREQLAQTSVELWQYKYAEARSTAVELAKQIKELKGTQDGTQPS